MSVQTPLPATPHTTDEIDRLASWRPGELGVVWTLWWSYGAFYFCRQNSAVFVTGLKAPADAGGLGMSPEVVGFILAAGKIVYGVGQLLNGQLAERFSSRQLLAIGMFCSAAFNVLFGFSTGFYFLLFAWAMNGYVQSLGWPPTVRIVGKWVPVHRRGKAVGIIGTGYQITLGLTFFIAGQSAELLGWRAALYVPAAVLVASGFFMLAFLREAPDEDSPAAHGEKLSAAVTKSSHAPWVEVFWLTLSNPALWLLGLALGLVNACRYGFIDWGISHLIEVQNLGVGKAAFTYIVLPVGAIGGAYLAGWATDRFFGSRRAPVMCVLLVALGVLTLAYESVSHSSVWGTIGLLMLIGFCLFGPQTLLVGTGPADLARRGTTAAAAGFVNFLGYMGASAGDIVTGYYQQEKNGGWKVAIYIWAGWAFAAALFAGLLWNHTAKHQERS